MECNTSQVIPRILVTATRRPRPTPTITPTPTPSACATIGQTGVTGIAPLGGQGGGTQPPPARGHPLHLARATDARAAQIEQVGLLFGSDGCQQVWWGRVVLSLG